MVIRNLLAIVLVTFVLSAKAQTNIEGLVKTGTKLVYRIDTKARSYDCILTVTNLAPYSFSYTIIDSANATGTITNSVTGLKKGSHVVASFTGKDQLLDDETTSMILSEKIFNSFHRNTKPIPFKIANRETSNFGRINSTKKFEVKLNGTLTPIAEELVKQKIKYGRKYIATGEEFVGYIPSGHLPIITRLKADFYIELLSIITNN